MENQNSKQLPEGYVEVNLRDIISAFAKKIWLILGITFIAAAVTYGVCEVLPKSYNIKTTIEIGSAPDRDQLNSIEDPTQVAKKISGDFYGASIREQLNINEKEYPKISVDNFSDSLISISINSSKVQRSEAILKELGAAVINDYQPQADQKKAVVSANIDILNKDINRLANKIQSVEAEKKVIDATILSLNNELLYGKDITLSLALASDQQLSDSKQQDIESLYSQINQDDQQINTMKGLLDEMKPTAVIAGPAVSQSPVSPHVLLSTILAAVLGFFAGTFLAFGIEWWKKSTY